MAAQLAPYPLIRPGFKGLNKSKAADTTLGGAWALELQNAVFDDAGRVASRRGWMNQTPNGMPIVGYVDLFTKLLLHMDGVNNGSVFTDSSSYAHTVTSNGPVTDTTDYKFATASYNGIGAHNGGIYITSPGSEFTAGSSNFTNECFLKLDNTGVGTTNCLTRCRLAGAGDLCTLNITAAGKISAAGSDGAVAYSLTGTTTVTPNVWHHIALVRSGNTFTAYLDGQQEATTTPAAINFGAPSNKFTVGFDEFAGNATLGRIDDFRCSIGVARYTGSSFTVPTAPLPSGAIVATVNVLHEYLATNGGSDPISAGNKHIWHSVTAPVDITGALTPTNNNWQFVNFRGYVLGFQEGHAPIFYSGAGTFVPLTATLGAVPSGNAAVAAFGRVWAVDSDQQTIKYCALLDPHDWGSSDAGSIDMRTVWTKGVDTVQGLAAFGAALVVFGKKHIIVWTDGQGSTIGLDPATMYVVDTIEGTGLQARDTIQTTGTGDVLFLSPTGLQSLARVIQTKNNPLAAVDMAVNQYLRGLWISEDPRTIRSTFNATEQFYLLILPKSGTTFCFDTRMPNEDGTLRCAEWPGYGAYSAASLVNGNMLVGFAGNIGKYSTYLDNAATYNFVYKSPWLTLADMAPQFEFKEKIPKRIAGIIYTGAVQTFSYTVAYDFNSTSYGSVGVTTTAGRVSEYGTAEYGTNGVYNTTDVSAVAGVDYAEYGPSYNLLVSAEELSGAGRWVQIGVTSTINASFLAVQQLDLYTKLGANLA